MAPARSRQTKGRRSKSKESNDTTKEAGLLEKGAVWIGSTVGNAVGRVERVLPGSVAADRKTGKQNAGARNENTPTRSSRGARSSARRSSKKS